MSFVDIFFSNTTHTEVALLCSEHGSVDGYQCLFAVDAFSRLRLKTGLPPVILLSDKSDNQCVRPDNLLNYTGTSLPTL